MISPAIWFEINKLIIDEHEFQLFIVLVIGLTNHPFHKFQILPPDIWHRFNREMSTFIQHINCF